MSESQRFPPVPGRPAWCRAGLFAVALLAFQAGPSRAENSVSGENKTEDPSRLLPLDVFELEFASDPQIAPDGMSVVYVRNFMDIMTDSARQNLWTVRTDGTGHRPLSTGNENDRSPRFSPDGTRLAFVSNREGGSELWVRYLDTGQTAKLTHVEGGPGVPVWSPDGNALAFVMFVREDPKPFTAIPKGPEGAKWAPAPKVIETLDYRADGAGYLPRGNRQLFVLPASGGTARQVTFGTFNVGGEPTWTPEGTLIFSSNRHEDWEYAPNDTDLWELNPEDGELTQLTDRLGPDQQPSVSPDGRWLAYVGYDEKYLGYQNAMLTVRARASGGSLGPARELTADLDRSIDSLQWSVDGLSFVVRYDDTGATKLARVDLDGELRELVADVGGTSPSRPYSSGDFALGRGGAVAYTFSRSDRPADVGLFVPPEPTRTGSRGRASTPTKRVLTALNEDLLAHKQLGLVEEIRTKSSYDGLEVQGWLVKPPGFEAGTKYPLILEIHGGPFASYGPYFATEIQLYAAAGYAVLYANPRGSTSYGEQFANYIHHNYPSQDYDDLMSLVDAAIGKGFVDSHRLYVTGGSGGGVLTAWIVGKTDRFRAAVSAKPVINWYSFVLVADGPAFFSKYWFGAFPWEDPAPFLRRSPLSYVGNVKTPTMLLTGEEDYRTPISESEQFYTALKLRKVPTALVRIPEASHGIADKPSHLMEKVLYILEWFRRW